jgi:membrane protein
MFPLLSSFIVDCYRIYKKFSRDEIAVYAAQASFFIVIAAFPFIMLLLTLIQFIPSVNQSDLLAFLIRITPEMVHSILVSIVSDLYIKSPGTVVSLTAVTALWSASLGIMSIERGLNRIYECVNPRNYVVRRLICSLYTIVFMISSIAALLVLVLGVSIRKMIVRRFPFMTPLISQAMGLGGIASVVILFLSFIALYTALPWKKQKPLEQIPGALFSVCGWGIFSYLFSIYFKYFKNFSYMYGSLTAIVLLMLWLYFCIYILFLGGVVNHYIRHPYVDL